MNYEKKYNEALARAKALYGQPLVDNTLLETILPELKESKDEKVRKALIEMVHDTPSVECEQNYNVPKADILAWLKKQGHEKNKHQ